MLLEVGLICIEHAIEPSQQFLGTMVRVEYDRNSVCGCDRTDIVGGSNGTGYGSLLVAVGQTFTAKKGRAALRGLEDDGSFDIACALESCNNC